MGMFDEVRCRYPLPDPQHQHLVFQTKDLECMMHDYTITQEGRLLSHGFDAGRVRPGTERALDTNYHGELNFYTSLEPPSGNPAERGEWVEYRAKFSDGQLVEIERVANSFGF